MASPKNNGPAHCLFDISQGQSREVTRERWTRGDYGPAGLRPRAHDVDNWLRFVGR